MGKQVEVEPEHIDVWCSKAFCAYPAGNTVAWAYQHANATGHEVEIKKSSRVRIVPGKPDHPL